MQLPRPAGRVRLRAPHAHRPRLTHACPCDPRTRPVESAESMPQLLDLEFVTVIGKGGVGKTTVTAALALAAAARGKRVLVAMCNVKERMSWLLEVAPIGVDVRNVLPRVDAVNMTPAHALAEYGMMILKVRALYRAIFENRWVSAFLRGTPGIEAWSMLGKAFWHATEDRLEDGSRRYDMVILDAPATGHGLEMLRVPKVLVEIAPPGLLRREAERAWALFHDTERAGVALVTLPEDMPTSETLELYDVVTGELALPVAGLIVNCTLPVVFDVAERSVIAGLPARLGAGSSLGSIAAAARVRALREGMQEESFARLARIPAPRTDLPLLFVPEFRRAAIEKLSGSFR